MLKCADCGGNFLHQFRVQVFNREREDAKTGLRIDVVYGKPLETSKDTEHGNPSDRRDGIRIYFNCENCPHISVLAIYQHKGTEYLTWLT